MNKQINKSLMVVHHCMFWFIMSSPVLFYWIITNQNTNQSEYAVMNN